MDQEKHPQLYGEFKAGLGHIRKKREREESVHLSQKKTSMGEKGSHQLLSQPCALELPQGPGKVGAQPIEQKRRDPVDSWDLGCTHTAHAS